MYSVLNKLSEYLYFYLSNLQRRPIYREGNKSDTANYWPISLMSLVFIITEGTVHDRTNKLLEKYRFFNNFSLVSEKFLTLP